MSGHRKWSELRRRVPDPPQHHELTPEYLRQRMLECVAAHEAAHRRVILYSKKYIEADGEILGDLRASADAVVRYEAGNRAMFASWATMYAMACLVESSASEDA